MSNNTSNTSIAKNTMFLYFRMLLTMAVGLFTSRIVLKALGVEDYGIYTLIGGIVIAFNFINQSLLSATQRFLSYELGKKTSDIKTIFSTCAKIHFIFSLFFFIIAETIGLWFVNTQINIPIDRAVAMNWVYQFSVLGCVLQIIRCPYNAAIISYEKMSIFAYFSILESVMKLITVYLLIILSCDKLILYSIITFCIILITLVLYIIYTYRTMPEIRLIKIKNKQNYRNILNFSKWTILGSLANMVKQQGLGIIVNIFHGVTVNAAIGISNQVNGHISAFVNSFQQALNPQLIKSEAGNDKIRQINLIYQSSKLSFLIMLALAFPIMLNLEFILGLWLGEFPQYTVSFCHIIIMSVLVETLSGPLWVTIYATGKVKTYQIVISSIALMNLPLSYLVLALDYRPESVFVIKTIIACLVVVVQLLFLRKYIKLNIFVFFKKVIVPLIAVILLLVPTYLIKYYIKETDFATFTIESIVVVLYEFIIIYCIGLNKNERAFISSTIKRKIKL